MEFIHFLFEDYSKRDLTEKTDRSVAISGLEARIARALGCQSRYGIFEQYLHRNLLWQASDNKMERIEYPTRNVPSWSWMAYNGGIQFMDIPFGTVNWIDNLRFDKGCELVLITDVGEFRDCTMEPDEKHYAILDFGRTKRGWIQYDVEEDEDLFKERCAVAGKKSSKDKNLFRERRAVVGKKSSKNKNLFRERRAVVGNKPSKDKNLFRERRVVVGVVVGKKSSKDKDKIEDGDRLDVKEYYILVVRPTSVDGEYKRVGVGLIQSDYVVRQRINVRVM